MYRDDHQAARARLDVLEREHKLVVADNERLARELVSAKEWIGGPRRRLALAAGVIATVAAVGVAMFVAGRGERPVVAIAEPPPLPLPRVATHRLVEAAIHCDRYGNGVALLVGADQHIFVSPDSVELETPRRVLLTPAMCPRMFATTLAPMRDGTVAGSVQLDCDVGTDRVRTHITFKQCR